MKNIIKVRITELPSINLDEEIITYIADNPHRARCDHHKSAIKSVYQLRDIITMGNVIAEPIFR